MLDEQWREALAIEEPHDLMVAQTQIRAQQAVLELAVAGVNQMIAEVIDKDQSGEQNEH